MIQCSLSTLLGHVMKKSFTFKTLPQMFFLVIITSSSAYGPTLKTPTFSHFKSLVNSDLNIWRPCGLQVKEPLSFFLLC